MKILTRYILRTLIPPFLFGSFVVMFLFLFQFLMRYLDELVGKGLDAWVIIQLIGLNLAWMVVLAVPMGVLFSTLMTFGNMASVHEITIIKASGGSLIKIMMPIIIAGLLLTIFLYWFNDSVLPEANHQSKILLSDIQRKKPTFSIEAGQFSTQLEGYTILARSVDSSNGVLKGVTIYDNTKSQRLNIASADTATVHFSGDYNHVILSMLHGEVHQFFLNEPHLSRKINYDKYKILIPASGFSFERTAEGIISRGDREMHISDMQKIVDDAMGSAKQSEKRIQSQLNKHFNFLTAVGNGNQQTKDESNFPQNKLINFNRNITTNQDSIISKLDKDALEKYGLTEAEKRLSFLYSSISSDIAQKRDFELRAKQYKVEIYKKYAIPFACLIFVLIGCPLGIITRNGNFGISAAISLGFYIFYWACLIGGEKLADRGMISPWLSMWGGNIIIGIFAILLTFKVSYEISGFKGKYFLNFFKKINFLKSL